MIKPTIKPIIRKIKSFFTLEHYFVKLFGFLFLASFTVNIYLGDIIHDLKKDHRYYVKDKKIVHEELALLNIGKKRFILPLKGRITSGYGYRLSPINSNKEFHCGIDIAVPIGVRVLAAESGRVLYNGWRKGYGSVIILRHTGGYVTIYAHNKYNYKRAKVGKWVNRGSVIALSGDSGTVTGPHLHFEIRKSLNPLWFFGK